MATNDKSDTNRGMGAKGAQSNAAESKAGYGYKHADRRKAKVLKYLQVNMGIVKYACMDANISRQTFYRWMEEDRDFADAVANIGDDTGDYVEKKLLGLIRNDDTKAILFYCETKLKDRGYFRKTQNDTTLRTDEVEVSLDLGF